MSQYQSHVIREAAFAGIDPASRDGTIWKCVAKAELFDAKTRAKLSENIVIGNTLVYGGASILWEYAIGNGTTSTGSAKHYLNAKAALGVGDSSAAAAKTQKQLQAAAGATHRQWVVMSATFPSHTTGSTVAGAAQITFKSTYTSTQANFAWKEWGVFNIATTAAVQRMLNRKAGAALITKTSAATASLTVTITTS